MQKENENLLNEAFKEYKAYNPSENKWQNQSIMLIGAMQAIARSKQLKDFFDATQQIKKDANINWAFIKPKIPGIFLHTYFDKIPKICDGFSKEWSLIAEKMIDNLDTGDWQEFNQLVSDID